MSKIIALLIAVLAVLLLSGCIDNQSAGNKNVTAAPTAEQTANIAENDSTGVSNPENLTAGTSNGTLNTSSGSPSNWCVPGSNISVNMTGGAKVFTVVGETTYQGHDVCRADLVAANGTTTKYYSEDGKFQAMNSTASGKNATAEAVSNVSTY